MRKGISDADLIEAPGGKVIGVCLGYDFTAEHEFGIERLQRDFGLDIENELGFEARKNNIVPPGLEYLSDKKNSALAYSRYFTYDYNESSREERLRSLMNGELAPRCGKDFASAWDEESFGINAKGRDSRKIVDGLYKAIKNNDCVITLQKPSTPFSNPGLSLLVYSLIPENYRENARKVDKDAREEYALFRKLEQESGVLEALEKAGKQFHYLGIKRLDNGEPLWWLNPWDQKNDNYGWFTTEDLREWAEGRGRIIRTNPEE